MSDHSVLERYTGGEYLEANPDWHAQDSPWKARQILRAIERAGITPRRVAEIGCGAGKILRELAPGLPDTRFVGYDISPHAVEIASRQPADRVEFRLADMLAEEGEPYDLVLCIDVFEHVEDYFGFLRALARRGAYVLFHIPLNLSVQSVLRVSPIMGGRRGVGHIHYYTKETALATLEDTGYTVVDHFYTAGSIEKPRRKLRNRLASVPRRALFRLNPDVAVRILGGYSLMAMTRTSR